MIHDVHKEKNNIWTNIFQAQCQNGFEKLNLFGRYIMAGEKVVLLLAASKVERERERSEAHTYCHRNAGMSHEYGHGRLPKAYPKRERNLAHLDHLPSTYHKPRYKYIYIYISIVHVKKQFHLPCLGLLRCN